MVVFAGVFIGLIVGWVTAWINQGKWRKAAHQSRLHLEEEIAKKNAIEKRLNANELISAENQAML